MNNLEKDKIFIIKNKYNNDIFHTRNYNKIESIESGIEFIRVFKPDNPRRTFLVNREAFEILNK